MKKKLFTILCIASCLTTVTDLYAQNQKDSTKVQALETFKQERRKKQKCIAECRCSNWPS